MLTVKEAAHLIKNAKDLKISWGGLARGFNPEDVIDMSAYGNFAVDSIHVCEKGCVEIDIAIRPVIIEEAEKK